ncbi:MAG: metallophosphoesterase [Chloroflexota bacterium]
MIWLVSLGIIVSIGGILILLVLNQHKAFTVTQISIPIDNLPSSFEGYRIAHISDLHMDSWLHRADILRVSAMIRQQAPDLIVMTGDFVTLRVGNKHEDMQFALADFSAPDGVLAVLGNHDHWHNAGQVREILRSVGIHELCNAYTVIEHEGNKLYVAGVDTMRFQQGDLTPILATMPADAPAILLAHEPDFALQSAPTKRFALQLSGHTHAGQIQLPPFGILKKPRNGEIYSEGLYRVTDRMAVYVTRGIGSTGIPVRLFCPPEITMITLQSS